MTQCCVNPICHQDFKFFNAGEIYALEDQSLATQFFWMCPACSVSFVLRLVSGCLQVVARSRMDLPAPLNPTRWLRLAFTGSGRFNRFAEPRPYDISLPTSSIEMVQALKAA